MKKEQLTIEFTDGTEGLITLETSKGRVDIKAEYADVRVYYLTEKVGNKWTVKRCNDGRCYDTVKIADKLTKKEAISEIILDVRKNQVRTAYTYIIETTLGPVFEVVATSESLAKKCVRFKCDIPESKMHIKEIKVTDESKQQKAKLGGYADFIKQIHPTHSDEPNRKESRGTVMKRTEEQYNKYITIITEKRTGRADITVKTNDGNLYYYVTKEVKGWLLKRCVNGFCYNAEQVGLFKTLKLAIECIHGVCDASTEQYRIEEDTLSDIEKDIADSVPIEETESFEVPVEDEDSVEVIDRAYEILSNPLTELDVRTSAMKSVFNSYYGKQVIDAEMGMKKTELNGFHVSGVITETGIMMLSCDIYAQDLDIKESYLSYNVGNGYAVYDEISLTRIEIFPNAESVKQYFVSRVKALEAETIKTLY